MRIGRLVSSLAVALGLTAFGTPAAMAGPCAAAPYRAFDFWIGDWQIRGADGKLTGTNKVQPEYDGCVIREQYAGASGYSGGSVNIYDASRNVWHQTWTDAVGTLLTLEGGVKDGKMVLEGQGKGPDNKPMKHRVTWAPQADGGLTQLWEATDLKGQWQTVFDVKYSKK
ncbi:MAG: hypothetical protein V4843_22150 [Pseudomonadota bacterium]